MKRIVFCFDGTACVLSSDTPTNVVLTAASIRRTAANGVSQVVYYDEGVGVGSFEDQNGLMNKVVSGINKFVGGGIGWGVTENIREAYRFLIFNYDPGDEIFVFGFSRGAFTARSFVGLLHCVGPISRLHASKIDEAMKLYHQRVKDASSASEALREFRSKYSGEVRVDDDEEEWRVKNVPGYEKGAAKILKIKFLGVWDSVSAMGAPEVLPGSSKINVGFQFHDTSISNFIESAWHAVALDERRQLFPPLLFGDLTLLNEEKKVDFNHQDAPYQERYFPGDHGSVGGGGDIRGLSDRALAWILRGAKLAGLELDIEKGTRIHSISPDALAPLTNMRNPNPDFVSKSLYIATKDRKGPDYEWQISPALARRWGADAAELEEKKKYRPVALRKVGEVLDSIAATQVKYRKEVLERHKVEKGETLWSLAHKYYGDGTKRNAIFLANRDILDHPDEIFPGFLLIIPKLD